MTRYEMAERLQSETGYHVEWNPQGGGYVIECIGAGTARDVRRIARELHEQEEGGADA